MNEKIKIAVFSSAKPDTSDNEQKLAESIAEYLVEKNVSVVTGGSAGIPGAIIEKTHELRGDTIMFSPDKDIDSHEQRHDNHELKYYNQVIYGNGFTSRSLEMINYVDGALVLNGRTGTLCEFTISVEEGLPVAVLVNSGGISDYLPGILKIVNKEFPSKILFGEDYKKQIDLLINEIKG